MALNLHLPIVPISINGTFGVMPSGSYSLTPQKIELIIHDPIFPSDVKSDNLRDAALKIRETSDLSRMIIEKGLWEDYK